MLGELDHAGDEPIVDVGARELQRRLAHEERWRGRPEWEIRAAQEAAVRRRFNPIARSQRRGAARQRD
jgi:hypothetical protein